MGFWDDIVDWASDKVQTMTGEKERREKVAQYKLVHEVFKEETTSLIRDLNVEIEKFNEKIKCVNLMRKGGIKSSIEDLSLFLGEFGELKEGSLYREEMHKEVENLPEKKFERNEDYILEIDWSKEDVFTSTFFLSPIGMKYKTNKQTYSMIEAIDNLKMEADHIKNELTGKKFIANIDIQICNLYIECIDFIITYIQNYILPELELVEGFFQAQKINDELICNDELIDIVFKNDIESIKETMYFKHYLFVRNTFVFYIMAYNIYNTPVLTRLLDTSTETTKLDLVSLTKQGEVLKNQGAKLDELVLIKA